MYGTERTNVKPGGPNTVRSFRTGALICLISATAHAQSPALLESVRVHRADATTRAHEELQACTTAKCPDQARLALLNGVLALSDGDATTAVQLMSANRPPRGLEAIHGWYFGEAQAWAAQSAAAVKTLQKARKAAPAWLSTRIDRRLAELYVELKQPEKATALLDVDPDVSTSPELLLTRALAREAARQPTARADWKTLALRFPAHPHGQRARARLLELNDWKLTFDEQLSRANALLNAGATEAALEALNALSPEKNDARARVALFKGQALLTRGKERDAEAKKELTFAAQGTPGVAAQAVMTLARRAMRLSDHAGAREWFKKLDETWPNDGGADEAHYLGAWLAMTSLEFDTAVKEFASFEEHHPESKKRDEARWFRGFSLFRAKKYAESREVLATLARDFPRSSLVPQALYWATRAAQLAPAPDAGAPVVDFAAEFRTVLAGFPGTFYAVLAVERLHELGQPADLPFTNAPRSLKVKTPAGLELATSLARTGLYRDAALEVTRAVSAMPTSEALNWGHALQALGDFAAAHAIAARYLWGPVYTQRSPEALALMYPRAFQASVEAWSKENQLEPALAWAIMRRESAFAPDVTSVADARGLMQLIPPTARNVTQRLKLPDTDEAELYSPDWNVRLGTWYLHALMDRLQHPTLVAGAYNGGPDAVAKWARERGGEPLDQWVEEIPYKETRGYVKQVTTDLFIYRQLYGTPRTPLSLSLPVPNEGVNF